MSSPGPDSFELRRLTRDDSAAVLAFELKNRQYFSQFISDRGDDFYENFSQHHEAMMVQQDDGACLFHILVETDGGVVGRVNLYDLKDAGAVLGYRMAQDVAGRGTATAAVRSVMALARDELGLRVVEAVVTDENVASARVLQKAGFELVGSGRVAGKSAKRYQRTLAPPDAPSSTDEGGKLPSDGPRSSSREA